MNLLDIFLMSVALSLDSFAVSLTIGLCRDNLKKSEITTFVILIGLLHFLMLGFGSLAGSALHQFIAHYDHWVAFSLLSFLGVKAILDSLSQEPEKKCNISTLSFKASAVLAVALSIDALVTGVSLAMVKISIGVDNKIAATLLSALIVGITSGGIALTGVKIGKQLCSLLGEKLSSRATIFGGVVLILIGVKQLF